MQGPKKVRGNKDLLTASNPQIRRSRRFLEGFDWGPWSQLAAFHCPDDSSWFLPLRNFGVRVRDQRIFLGLTWHIGCRQQGTLNWDLSRGHGHREDGESRCYVIIGSPIGKSGKVIVLVGLSLLLILASGAICQ
ncbi:hypothetical protein BO83DRAFT_88744 [Aspergillus eucalypticola CBS 122712]|uniref:Uncharacterized protein n=1 Tax=Aspergillus eucalypticola (strain CBS 122712 / IBT 29274) TaxID=1448314 RepID=A0A317V5Q9_ASPEC|nr:uncharacterized protein BO83DRAFT_88744 [Aspergillus eucalypticola CBS 122712]PWY68247.1 hypothetical protein BO83DRAFT_88744 [Aspergillus eucalypticola CBS 122712]